MKNILKIFILTIILALTLSLFACNLIPDKSEEPIVYGYSQDGESYNLKIFPDNTFELNSSQVNGINETAFVIKGNYSAGNEEYALSITSYEMKKLTFGLPYETKSATAEEITDLNDQITKISIIDDNTCMIGNSLLFKNGEKGSSDTVVKVISPYKTYGNDYDFTCATDGTIVGYYLVKYYADGNQEKIIITEEMLGEHDFSTAGMKTVSITYEENKVYQAEVKVNDTASSPYVSLNRRIPINTTIENFRADTSNRIYISGSSPVYFTDAAVIINGFDTTKDKEIKITITYMEYSEEETITVYDPDNLKIEELVIDSEIGVVLGQELSFTGDIYKNDGSDADVTADITIQDYDKNKIGPQMVSFVYQDITVKKVFYVYDDTNKDVVLEINVENKNEYSSYITYENGALNLSNHELVLSMIDGTEQTVELTANMFGSFDPDKFYNQSYQFVTISYTHTGYTYYTDVRINKAAD